MSMLSAQVDELRSMSESVGLAMPQAATLMMEAADTILSLRDRAQELQAENAKLRELVKNMVLSHHMELCPVCPFKDECFDGSHKYECIAENRLEAQACKLGIEVG